MAAHKMRPGLSCVTLEFCWMMLLLCIGMDVVICTVGDYCSATEDCNIPSEVCIDYVCACNSGYDELQINNTCQKSDSAPLLFCVDYLKVRINSSQGTTVDPAKYVTVAGGVVTLNPNTLTVNENTLSRPQTVEAIAVSPNGLVSSCKFKIYTIAWTCLPKSFPDLPNAVESCTSNDQKLMCTVTCSSGHVHRNGYASKIYQCTGNNTWSPALPPEQCRGYSHLTYSFTVTPTYAVAGVPASLCSSDHESKIRNSLSTFSARASVCSDTGGNINFNYKSKEVKVTSILTTFNVVFDSKNLTRLHMINCYNIIRAKIQDGSINLLYSGTLNCGSSFPSVSVSLNAGNTIVSTGTGVCPFNTNTLFTSVGVDICLKCSPGEFWNESACFTCPDGLFNPVSSDNNSCISCGTNMIPSADKASCIDLCKDGFYSKDGMDPCKACPRDTYWFNATTCKPCDEGTSTFGSQGATSALQCNVPAIPENLMVFHVGSRELSLSWTTPNVVNGNVKGYRILVFKELSCFTEIYLEILGGLNISHMNCLYHETHATGSSSIFSYHLTNLKPFTNYTIQVVAVSTFVGFPASVYISTKQEVPQTPSNLTVITRGRTSAAVKWSISGDRPGITTFYFDLVAYTPAENKSASVNGFYKRTFNLIGLQENWVYTLSVLAGTPNGNSSWSFPVYLKTLPAPPGQVESLNLTRPDGTYFNQVKVQWTPPSILEQNSDITGYVLTHNTSGIEVTIYLIANNTSEKAGYMYILNVKPETIYVIKVYAIGNANLNGLERNQSYNAPPGAPPKPQVPVMPHSSSTGEAKETSKINIKIDTYFFTNGINGVIRDFGLLVCKDTCPRSVDRSHFKKENFSDINQVPSWKQAKINGLKFYRATWNKFIDLIRGSDPTRKKRSVTVSYVIGQDGSCVTQDVYCDGELDAGSSYIVIAFCCTSAGCTESDPYGPFSTKTNQEDSDEATESFNIAKTNIIFILVGLAIATVVLVCGTIAVLLIKKKRKANESSKKHKQIYSDLPEFPGTQTEVLTLRPVKIKDFPEYVADMIKNGNVKIAMEFEDLNNASPKFSTDVANLDANKVKNRYANILPFDESRVKLSPFDSENDNVSGYINANYMPGHSSEKEYIATQRPLPGTVNDFWRMVWEKNVSICVMLTLDKKHLVKKSNYWPSLVEKEHRYGNITVHISSEVNANSYVVRVFKLMMGKQKHKLKHFQFLIWEDCETNMSRDVFISFVNNVRLQLQPEEKEWPIVVHCSSGVGRTGTFIAIDFLMQFIENNDFDADIDILNYIYEMRKHRMKMVQTTQQLIFIYECAKIMIQRKYKCQEAMNKKNAFIVEIETDVKDTYEDAM